MMAHGSRRSQSTVIYVASAKLRAGGALRGRGPPGQCFVDGLRGCERSQVGRKFRERAVRRPIAGTQVHLRQPVEHIELGEGQGIEPVDARGVADDDRVEPATAARTAR